MITKRTTSEINMEAIDYKLGCYRRMLREHCAKASHSQLDLVHIRDLINRIDQLEFVLAGCEN